MFRGFFEVHDRCPVCGLRYQVESGAWLGALAIGYTMGALVALLLTFVEIAYEPIRSAGLHPLWTITVVSLVATVPLYRLAKGVWFALLWLYGFTEDARGPGTEDRPGH